MNFWKWSGESRYPGALSPVLENFRPAFSPEGTTRSGIACVQTSLLARAHDKKKKKKRLHFESLVVKASETKDFLKSILNAHITIGN